MDEIFSKDGEIETIELGVCTYSVQIRAVRHTNKTDCGVGVAAVGYTCCAFLVMVDGPAIYTVTQAKLRQN